MIFKLESPEFPGGVTGVGESVRMHDQDGDESQLKRKTANFFQVEAGHIFVLEHTEGE